MRNLLTFSVLFALNLAQAFAWNPHEIFRGVQQLSNHTTYTHRLLINQPAYIPCFKSTDSLGNQSSTIYWSHRGFRLDRDSSFISALWDLNGTLMIYHVLPRKIYLWCHYQTDSVSKIFIHHLEFVSSPFVQVIYAVEMNANFTAETEKILDDFYVRQMKNCIIQSDESGIVVLEGIYGIEFEKDAVQKTAVLEAIRRTCETQLDCTGVSLDFFSCYINSGPGTAFYSIDFSTTHNVEMGIFIETNFTDFFEQINQTVTEIEKEIEFSKGRILSSGFENIPRTSIDLNINIKHRMVKICLGVAGRLNIEGKLECG
ncbi:unnamed protein product [Rodentolepis nana]|uniref:Secreted protein n=1 Tax=Rodentolepis nana TaxID=102285 RepID=A0A0R3TCQ2_RODNA|nr:unnamed protein product [Rodentolepis nana]